MGTQTAESGKEILNQGYSDVELTNLRGKMTLLEINVARLQKDKP
jgi:hypothetical protein